MSSRGRTTFLALILIQAAHSIEEYSTRLYDILVPAHFVSDLLSVDRRVGFVIFNAALVGFGLWCFFGPVRRGARAARVVAWSWAILELGNGLAHIAWTISARAYRPGLTTAPILATVSLLLAWQLRRRPREGAG